MAIRHAIYLPSGVTKPMMLTARKAIIENCKECMGWNTAEVRRCTAPWCPLFPFRTHDAPRNTC